MTNNYEMVTVKSYLDSLGTECVSLTEEELSKQVERYLLNVKRAQTNAKIVESLLA